MSLKRHVALGASFTTVLLGESTVAVIASGECIPLSSGANLSLDHFFRYGHHGRMGTLSTLFSDPLMFFVFVLVFLLTLSIHEFSHALAGHLLGDPTAERANRLTLNPFAHVDLIGFLALVTIGFGWGKPVPFNPYNLKYPRWGATIVAIAGPISNLLVGTLCALLVRVVSPVFGPNNLLTIFLVSAAFLNFLLMLFNLIPLPPLDGSKALVAILADDKYRNLRTWVETKGPMVLMGLIILDVFLGLGVFSWISTGARALLQFMIGS